MTFSSPLAVSVRAPMHACPHAGLEVLWAEQSFRRYQSGQPTVFSGAYINPCCSMFTRGSYCSFVGVLDRLAPLETQFRPQHFEPPPACSHRYPAQGDGSSWFFSHNLRGLRAKDARTMKCVHTR